MTDQGSTPRWMTDLRDYIRSEVRAIVGPAPTAVSPRFGTVTSRSPLRVLLDGDTTPVTYAPPCLYPARQGDRVWCIGWGTQLVIVGPVAAGTDTGWQTLNGFGDGWGSAPYAESEDAVWRRRGDEVTIEGLVTRWGSDAGWGQVASGLPTPRSGSSTLVGHAQYASRGWAPLVVSYSGVLTVESGGASGNCTTSDWVRLSARYTTT